MSEVPSITSESGGFERTQQPAETLIKNEAGRQRMFAELRKAGLANPSLEAECSSLRDHILNYASSERLGLDVSVLKEEIVKAYEAIVARPVATPKEEPRVAQEEVKETASPSSPVFHRTRRGPFPGSETSVDTPAQEVVVETPRVAEDVGAPEPEDEQHEEAPVIETPASVQEEIPKVAAVPEATVSVPAEGAPDVTALRGEVERIHKSLEGLCPNPLSLVGCEAYRKEYIPARVEVSKLLFREDSGEVDTQAISQKIEDLRTAAARVREEAGDPVAVAQESAPAHVVESIASTPEHVTQEFAPETPSALAAHQDKLSLVQMIKSKEVDEALRALVKEWTKHKGGVMRLVMSDPDTLSRSDLELIFKEKITIERVKNDDLPPSVRTEVAAYAMANIAERLEKFIHETGIMPHDDETLEYYLRRALAEQRLRAEEQSAAPLAKAA